MCKHLNLASSWVELLMESHEASKSVVGQAEFIAAVASTPTSNLITIFEEKVELGLILGLCDF